MAFAVNGYDITVNRNDYGVNIVWNFKYPDGGDFALDEYDLQLIIKKQKYLSDSESVFETTQKMSGNKFIMPLTEEITKNEVGVYYYAIRLIRGDDFVNTVLEGKFNIVCNTFEQGA